jgi:hypothetical protein
LIIYLSRNVILNYINASVVVVRLYVAVVDT